MSQTNQGVSAVKFGARAWGCLGVPGSAREGKTHWHLIDVSSFSFGSRAPHGTNPKLTL